MKNSEYKIRVAQWEAAQFWENYGISSPKDLCLEDIALARGVLVKEGPLQGMDARLIRKGNKGLIRVKDDIPEYGRKRFAIAHELGHWELHKDISQLFTCTEKDFMAKYKGSIEEIEANYFAVSLLMPENHFKTRSQGLPMSLGTVKELADYFITSLTATARRYTELSEDYCAIVCSEGGQIKWFQASDNFMSCFWISPGRKLNKNTIAGELFSHDGACLTKPEKIDILAWSEKNDCKGQNEFIEESIYMPKYQQVFSLLYLP
ncbi:MAG: ImmA/IrrE family metallo-endopeptidase [Planctomycetes bacterium]|nr:ImmA/IrrE family metallo-endopeptidase [Planctomycetota bacterium]